MSTDKKKDEIQQVRREEEGRSKRTPRDQDKIKAQREREAQWRAILRAMKFDEAMRALGLRPGTPEYEEFARIWRAYQQSLADAERQPRRPRPQRP